MNTSQRVDAAMFRHLLANASIPLRGSAVGCLLLALASLHALELPLVAAWVLLVLASLAIRYALTRRSRAAIKSKGFVRAEAVRYAMTTGLSGLVWGCAGLFIQSGDPLVMVVTITAIQSMVMGGVLTLGAFMPSFLAFAIPAMLPMMVVLAMEGSPTHLVIALYCVIFFMLMLSIARRYNASLRQTLSATIEKEDLLRALSEAHDSLVIEAKTDALTGIANRRRFDEVLEAEFARLQRSGAPLSVIILDVDHFKAFNDTYGHIAGDLCLKRVSAVFQKHLNRAADLAARYGGEEFAGILPETPHAGALAVAEAIRAEVAAQDMAEFGAVGQVTVSLGVVTLDCSRVQSTADAVVLADQQLYRAKAEGRNRVAAWSGCEALA